MTTTSPSHRSRIGAGAALLSVLLAGCLSDDEKTVCAQPSDCLDGYLCLENVCEPVGAGGPDGGSGGDDDGGDDGPGDGDGPDGGDDFELGTVEALEVGSWGLTAVEGGGTAVAATSADGGLGCALVGDEEAAPGGAAAVVLVKIAGDGDDRCPAGSYSIRNDPDECSRLDLGTQLRAGCALYERWDDSGELVARRLGMGGFVSVAQEAVSDTEIRCSVDFEVSFAGGLSAGASYAFSYDPFAPTAAFCGH